MQAAGNYYKIYETLIPAAGASTPTYLEFSDLIEVSANCGNTAVALQQVGKYAKIRVSAFVESGAAPERSIYDVAVVSGDSGFVYQTFDPTTRKLAIWSKCANNAQSTVAVFSGKNGGFDSVNGTSRMLYSAVEGDGATVEAMAGFKEVQGVSMSGLPQLAPDLSFVPGGSRGVSWSLPSPAGAFATVLNVTGGAGVISLLTLGSASVSTGTLSYRLTIDGEIIWNSAMGLTSNTTNHFLGSKTASAYSNPDAFAFKQSLKLEAAFSEPSAVGTSGYSEYRIRKIK